MEQDLTEYLVSSENLGRAKRLEDEHGRYVEYAKNTFPKGMRLDGLKIVVDCANGAAYKVAPLVLYELGAEVVAINVSPDGTNINKDCGATSTELLQEAVVKHDADLGIALDGDADRIMVCDEQGHVVDGDQIMALIAKSWSDSGKLNGNVVSTVMSNLGLERFLNENKIGLSRTAVGDRYVVEHMRENNCNLGGEQSGHIILSDYSTTGDGILAALQVLAVVIEEAEKPVSEVCKVFKPVPQVLKSVRYKNPVLLDSESMKSAIAKAESKIGDCGRILIRKSGTEPVVRVMAEGDDEKLVKTVVEELCDFVELNDKDENAKAIVA